MPKLITAIQRTALLSGSLLLIVGTPLTVWADDGGNSGTTPSSNTTTTATDPSSTTGPTTTTGPNKPTGKDAKKFHYDSQTGMWESDNYIWNPVTKQTTPKPADPTPDSSQSISQPDTGSGSNGGSNGSGQDNSLGLNNDSSNSIGNDLSQDANSGNASLVKNTAAGSALTGNAADVTNLVNMICNGDTSCAPSLLQGGLTTFSTDVYGNVQGDLMIDPSQLTNLATVNSAAGAPSDVTINAKNNSSIDNNIDLGANSGNAKVTDNTTAGDATSGDASAMANIVNVINSTIGAGKSFLGTVNIYGNLDGDILMPPDVLSQLVTSNAAPSLTTFNSPDSSQLLANLTNNTAINNNLNLSAQSGAATVADNTTAGNATSGDASTNITLLNLTGQQVIGADALLVFVNVSGKWVGMIVNAPGATSAALCDSSCTTSTLPTDTNINATNNNSITNNLTEKSASGDATVASNTTAGNATSGDAFAGANIVNISASQLALSNWLGILFINVFGSWNGSFGINTAAGNPTGGDSSATVADAVKQVKVFSFVPKTSGDATSYAVTPVASADNPSSNNHTKPTVLSASTDNKPSGGITGPHASMLWISGSLFALAGALGAESAYVKRKEDRSNFRKYLRSITVGPLKKS